MGAISPGRWHSWQLFWSMGSTSLWNVTAANVFRDKNRAGTAKRFSMFPLINNVVRLAAPPRSPLRVDVSLSTFPFRRSRDHQGADRRCTLFDRARIRLGFLRTHQIHWILIERNRHIEEADHHFIPALLAEVNFLLRVRV